MSNKKYLKEIIKQKGLEVNFPEWNFDLRPLLLKYDVLKAMSIIFWDMFSYKYPFQLCGMEFSGIPMSIAIQNEGHKRGFNTNIIIARKNKLSKTNKNLIEGKVNKNKIIFIDDILSSGSSLNNSIKELNKIDLSIQESFFIIDFCRKDIYKNILNIKRSSIFKLSDFGIDKFKAIL